MFRTCRVDAEALSSDESSTFAGSKDFSQMRVGKSAEFSVAEVMIPSNSQSILLESGAIRFSRKEDALTSSSKSLSFDQLKTKGSRLMLMLGFSSSSFWRGSMQSVLLINSRSEVAAKRWFSKSDRSKITLTLEEKEVKSSFDVKEDEVKDEMPVFSSGNE